MRLSPENERRRAAVVEWIHECEVVDRRHPRADEADARELAAARKALDRAIRQCQKPGVQRALFRRRPSPMYANYNALLSMLTLLDVFDLPPRSSPVPPPRWHAYMPRLMALYRLVTGRRPALWYKGRQASPAAIFISDALLSAGVRTRIRAVCAYPRNARNK